MLSNARLREIAEPATGRQPNGDRDPNPTPVWTGAVRCYLRRRQLLEAGTTASTSYVDELLVPLRSQAPLPAAGANWAADSIVVGDRRQRTEQLLRWTVDGFEIQACGSALDVVCLTLSDPRTP